MGFCVSKIIIHAFWGNVKRRQKVIFENYGSLPKKFDKRWVIINSIFILNGYNRYKAALLSLCKKKGGAAMKLFRKIFSRVVLFSLGILIQLGDKDKTPDKALKPKDKSVNE